MNEKLSSLIDGEIDTGWRGAALEEVCKNRAQREACELYWLIGDTMRREPTLSRNFTADIMAQLDQEPTILAPHPVVSREAIVRRRQLSIAAMVSGIFVAGWLMLNVSLNDVRAPAGSSIAKNEASTVSQKAMPAAADNQQQNVSNVLAWSADDPERGYLMVHQSYAAGTPMPGIAHYIRTVSDEPSK